MSLHNLKGLRQLLDQSDPLSVQGRVVRANGLIVETMLPQIPVGSACEILVPNGPPVAAEVVGFNGPIAMLMPIGPTHGVCEGCAVVPSRTAGFIPTGLGLLGRVVDAQMRPVDGGPLPLLRERAPLNQNPPAAMTRRRIHRPLSVGVRAIDSCLTLGEGQRVGIFAGPGVGKSVLLGMIAQNAAVDAVVVGLIGERGREVREFVERDLGAAGLARSVVVVATADEPPLVRLRAALAATAVAESLRAQGKRVMLLMDSLTRVAMALREIGLSSGEPPTSKGYPPSVFAQLPKLLERAGNDQGRGSITAVYTVLVEGDGMTDPVADACRAALDGHVILSRRLATGGHFPAIDLLESVSRVMNDVTTPEHRATAARAREVLALYRESADLVEIGAYTPGTNPRLDSALTAMPALNAFLRQGMEDCSDFNQSLTQLQIAVGPDPRPRHA